MLSEHGRTSIIEDIRYLCAAFRPVGRKLRILAEHLSAVRRILPDRQIGPFSGLDAAVSGQFFDLVKIEPLGNSVAHAGPPQIVDGTRRLLAYAFPDRHASPDSVLTIFFTGFAEKPLDIIILAQALSGQTARASERGG